MRGELLKLSNETYRTEAPLIPLQVVNITASSAPFFIKLKNMSMVQSGDSLPSYSSESNSRFCSCNLSPNHHLRDIWRQATPQSQLCSCLTWMLSYSPMKLDLSYLELTRKLASQADPASMIDCMFFNSLKRQSHHFGSGLSSSIWMSRRLVNHVVSIYFTVHLLSWKFCSLEYGLHGDKKSKCWRRVKWSGEGEGALILAVKRLPIPGNRLMQYYCTLAQDWRNVVSMIFLYCGMEFRI